MWARADKSLLAAADVNFFMGSEGAWFDFAHYFPRETGDPQDPPVEPPPDDDEWPDDYDMAVLKKLDAIAADVKIIKAFIEDMRKL
jgi:hypothetical protein